MGGEREESNEKSSRGEKVIEGKGGEGKGREGKGGEGKGREGKRKRKIVKNRK